MLRFLCTCANTYQMVSYYYTCIILYIFLYKYAYLWIGGGRDLACKLNHSFPYIDELISITNNPNSSTYVTVIYCEELELKETNNFFWKWHEKNGISSGKSVSNPSLSGCRQEHQLSDFDITKPAAEWTPEAAVESCKYLGQSADETNRQRDKPTDLMGRIH